MINKKLPVIPDLFEFSEIPYFELQYFKINQHHNYEKLMQIRKTTHFLGNIFGKVFAFWPDKLKPSENEEE